MKLKEIPYQPIPEFTTLKNLDQLIKVFTASKTEQLALKSFHKVHEFHNNFQTLWALSYIRMLSEDSGFDYAKEYELNNKTGPLVEEKMGEFQQAVLASAHRSFLEKTVGSQAFRLAEAYIQTHSPALTHFQQLENEYRSTFQQEFYGKPFQIKEKKGTFAQWLQRLSNSNREERKQISLGILDFAEQNEPFLEKIFSDLLINRQNMARVAGFKNYLPLGQLQHKRLGVTFEQLVSFRKGIKLHFKKIVTRIRELQEEFTGVEKLTFYDRTSYGEEKWKPEVLSSESNMEDSITKCLDEISPEAGDFFRKLNSEGYVLVAGKNTGFSFSTSLPSVHKSIIHIAGKIENPVSLTSIIHETGHAFQNESSTHWGMYEYIHGATESAEVFAHSLEFLSWKGMGHLFSGPGLVHFKLTHLARNINRLIRCCQAFELEEFIYSNPGIPLTKIDKKWLELETEYGTKVEYEGHPFLSAGKAWREFGHLYQFPLYLISYGLALIGAFSMLKLSLDQPEKAWLAFTKMARIGGSQSFPEMLAAGGFPSPFEENTLQEIAGFSGDLLEQLYQELKG